MAHQYAILIGIESYQDATHIRGVRYATADVESMRLSLLEVGFVAENIIVLLNERATKTTIEHHFAQRRLYLEADDTFLFFFAGHGYSTAGSNFIACCDTHHADLVGTGIDLSEMVKQFKSSMCKRIQIYLDCCNSEIVIDPSERSLVSMLSLQDIDRELKQAEHVACFSSCRSIEKSYSSDHLKHGIWTYHLTQAFGGEVPSVLNGEGLLLAGPLQSYLKRAVETTLREEYNDRRKQTPWMSASFGQEFAVANLAPLLRRKQATVAAKANKVKDVILSNDQYVGIRSLAGFQKNHKVPNNYAKATQSFVIKVAQGNIENEIERIHRLILDNLEYTRKELRVSNPDGAESGSIWTPDFEYTVRIEQLEDEPSEAVISRSLSEVRDQSVLDDEHFCKIFDNMFDTIRLTFAKPINVIEVIDLVEERKASGMKVKYPADLSHCNISIKGLAGTIRVEDTQLELTLPTKSRLEALVSAFMETMTSMHLIGMDKHLELPSPPAD